MAFLSNKTLKRRLSEEKIISDFNPKKVKSNAYELSMGDQVYVTTNDSKKYLNKGEPFNIYPGQFAVLLTEEKISIPSDLMAFISIRFTKKFRGLVNVSGFHVDPGFKGKLMFSVYNAGSNDIVVESGEQIFQIWFAELDDSDSTNHYNGEYELLDSISPKHVMDMHGNTVSPNALNKKIENVNKELESKLDNLNNKFTNLEHSFGVLKTVFITSVSALVVGWILMSLSPTENESQNMMNEPTNEVYMTPENSDTLTSE